MKVKAFASTLNIEFKLSVRDMNMVIFAIAMPVIVTLILGFVYGSKPAFEGAGYTAFEQSFGAMAGFGILASGLMGLPLAVSDYRDKRILKRYKCTPASPGFLLGVQLVKYAIYSVVSLLAVYIVSACFGYKMSGSVIAFIGAYLLVLISMYSIGMLVAALAPSAQKAGLICSLLYFPMLIFSGTTLPYEIMPAWLRIISDFLPMTQGTNLLKAVSLGLPAESMLIPLIVLPVLGIICSALSVKFFKWDK